MRFKRFGGSQVSFMIVSRRFGDVSQRCRTFQRCFRELRRLSGKFRIAFMGVSKAFNAFQGVI